MICCKEFKLLQVRRINYVLKEVVFPIFIHHSSKISLLDVKISLTDYLTLLIVFLCAFIYSTIVLPCLLQHFWQYQAVIILPSFSNLLLAHILEIYSSLGTELPSSLPLPINVEILLLYLLMQIYYIPFCCLIIVEHN